LNNKADIHDYVAGGWMSRFVKIVAINLAICGVLVVAYFVVKTPPSTPTSSETAAKAPVQEDADTPLIGAYELTKNPFKMKGQYVILDTGHMPMLGYADTVRATIGMKGIRFKHMLDDGLAIYSVLAAVDSLSGDEVEELAVELPDNNPPDVSRPWLVQVEGTRDGTNGYGATIQTATVKFIRYAVLASPQQSVTTHSDVPAPTPTPQVPVETQSPSIPEQVPTPPPAPIVRLTPLTLPTGDIVFTSPSGCKTILTRMLPNNQVQYVAIFEDGTTAVFSPNELDKAGVAAAEHCRVAN
jgi:hypothetical protein